MKKKQRKDHLYKRIKTAFKILFSKEKEPKIKRRERVEVWSTDQDSVWQETNLGQQQSFNQNPNVVRDIPRTRIQKSTKK